MAGLNDDIVDRDNSDRSLIQIDEAIIVEGYNIRISQSDDRMAG